MKKFDKTTTILAIITLFVLALAITTFSMSLFDKNKKTKSTNLLSSSSISNSSSNSSSSLNSFSSFSSSSTFSFSANSSSLTSSNLSLNLSSSSSNLSSSSSSVLSDGQIKIKVTKAESGKYTVTVLDSGSLAENKKFLIASKSFGLTLSSKNQLELDKIYLLDGVFEEEGKISVLLKSSPLEIKE